MSGAGPACRFCGEPLRGRAEVTWEGDGREIDDCARCGTYDLPLSLLPTVEALSPDARTEIAEYLASLAAEDAPEPMRFTPGFFGL